MSENLILDRFAEPVTALADTPALAAAELKRRFQAPAEELRQVHNALAEQHAALEDKVEGIVTETYGGTIHESMLDTPLAAQINAKAEQSALEAEAAARETLAQTVAQKCEVYFGTYTGDGAASRQIPLSFTPQALLVFKDSGNPSDGYGGLAFPGYNVNTNGTSLEIVENGFMVYYKSTGGLPHTNANNADYYFIAFK